MGLGKRPYRRRLAVIAAAPHMSLKNSLIALMAGAVVAVGLVAALPASAETPGSTLQPSANGRYVQWSDGTPVFLLSDTAWLMPGRYSNSEVINHATTRASQGFTSIQMTAVFPEVQHGTALQNINDIFTNGDMARPIGSYFDRVEWVVNTVTSKGLIVILNPFWKKTMDTYLAGQGPTKTRNYGKYLASRFVNNPRVAYFLGGDATPGNVRPELNAMGLGVLDAYTAAGKRKPLVAFHSKPGETSREAWSTGAGWLNLSWSYDYAPPFSGAEGAGGDPYEQNWTDWAKTPTMPIMFGEGFYDRNNGASAGSRWSDRYGVRRQAWWSTFSGGIGGYAYGAEPIWLHGYNGIAPATAATWDSGKDAARMKSFLTSTQWTRLQPDINHTFLTGGYGTYKYLDYAIASVADDKSFAVVYTPTAHTLNLQMPSSGRTYTLRWFDPSSGTYRAGSTTAASGAAVTMTTPGNNASGKPDWVIHVSSGVAVTPTSTPTTPYSTFTSDSSTLRLAVASGTNNVVQGTPATSSLQQWQVQANGPYVNLVNRSTGQCAMASGSSLTNGALIVQAACDTASTNQQWTLTSAKQVINRNSGKCLDVPARSTTAGAQLIQYTCSTTGATNQQWTRTTV